MLSSPSYRNRNSPPNRTQSGAAPFNGSNTDRSAHEGFAAGSAAYRTSVVENRPAISRQYHPLIAATIETDSEGAAHLVQF